MKVIANGADLKCSFGDTASKLNVLPANMTNAGSAPVATVRDCVPDVNIMPLGLCKSLANPTVAAATAANFGKLQPMPCKPDIVSPWAPPDPNFRVNGLPMLTDACACMCKWGGMIKPESAGQTFVSLEQGAPASVETMAALAGLTGGHREAARAAATAERPEQGHHVAHQVVCDATGAPVEGVRWRLRGPNGAEVAEGVTGKDGMAIASVPEGGGYEFEYVTRDDNSHARAVADDGDYELQEA